MSLTLKNLGREGRHTLLLALPMMAGQVSQMLMGVTDTVMVGRVGVIPLAAASFAGAILLVLFIAGLGFQIPISIFASQAHGREDRREAGEVLRHGLSIGLVSGLGVALSGMVLSLFLDRFGQEPGVVREATPYFQIVAWSLLPAMLEQGCKQFSEALGRPWLPMSVMLSAVGLNIFLNWVLIYGNLGAPAMGLTGAGWATLVSRVVSVVVMFVCIVRSGHYRPSLPQKWLAALDFSRIWQMAKLGGPLSLTLMLEVAAFGVAAIMMGWISAKSLAAHQIAMNCAATTFMFPLGLSFAARIRVGHAVGSKEWARLAPIGFSAMGLGLLIMITFSVFLILFNETVAGWFVKDRELVMLAASLMVIAGFFQIFDGLQVIAGGSLNGLADVKVPAFFALISYWGVTLPLAYHLGFRLGWREAGIWWAMAVGLALAATCGVTRFWLLTRKAGRNG